MPDLGEFQTAQVESENIGQTIDEVMSWLKMVRRVHERHWYDNNFFDDGYHFRYLSRSTGKIVDLSASSDLQAPTRAIPKASKQIRGVANLLVINDPTPVVYPSQLNVSAFANPQELLQAKQATQKIASLTGHWIEEEFKKQEISEKLALMVILAAKHGVSFMQVWPDAVQEKIRTQVYDAFDIYLKGNLTEIYDSPVLIKGIPRTIAEIKANELFDPAQRLKLSPDNKLASSEIKEAYEKAKEGFQGNPDIIATVILKEAFLKEYVSAKNRDRVKKSKIDRKDGDPVIRHSFVAGDTWLYDEYLDIPEYPFVEFRFEPGPIYQVPLIERFIPQNKSLDVITSRVERYVNTMVTGFWLKRQGEQWKPTNVPGGQVIEYMTTPPVQGNISPIPNFVFSFMGLLSTFIEEQGVTMSTLAKIPTGVRANAAIESLKESEYASLAIPQRRFKNTVKKLAQKFLDIADDYFVTPQTYEYLEKGEPQYFDVVGKNAMAKRQELKVPVDANTVPLSKDYRVDIEVEAGLGFTRQGKRDAILKLLSEFLLPLVKQGLIPPQAVKTIIEKVFETYQFGATAEFMESMDKYQNQGNMTDQQIQQVKVAVAEVLKDLKGSEMFPDQKTRIQETQVGVAQTIKDSGLMAGAQGSQAEPPKKPSESISFKDLPPEGQAQMAAQAGINISPEQVVDHQVTQQVLKKGGENASNEGK